MRFSTIASVLLVSFVAGASAQEDQSKPAAGRPPKVAFEVVNNTGEHPAISHVRAKGAIPVLLNIRDGRSEPGRRLKVFISVHERDMSEPHRFKPKRFVTNVTDNTQMTSQGQNLNIQPYEKNIKLPPGNYLFYVFLCDPSKRPTASDVPANIVDTAKLPGDVIRGTVCVAIVD